MLATIIPCRRFRATGPTLRANRVQLRLTELETRLTPAAPVIGDLSGVKIGDNLIVTGQLEAGSPSATTVAIAGDVSGTATVHNDGTFEFITSSPGIGTVTAQATNVDGSASDSISISVVLGSS